MAAPVDAVIHVSAMIQVAGNELPQPRKELGLACQAGEDPFPGRTPLHLLPS